MLYDYIERIFRPIVHCADSGQEEHIECVRDAFADKYRIEYLLRKTERHQLEAALINAVTAIRSVDPLNRREFRPNEWLNGYGEAGMGEEHACKWYGAIKAVYPMDLIQDRIERAKAIFDPEKSIIDAERRDAIDADYPERSEMPHRVPGEVQEFLTSSCQRIHKAFSALKVDYHNFAEAPRRIWEFGRRIDGHLKNCALSLDKMKEDGASPFDLHYLLAVKEHLDIERLLRIYFGVSLG